MYLAVIFGGKLPPKIAPKTKIAVIIVVNYYCKNGCSQRESNPQLALRRRLLYPFNYENECRIFGLFSLFGIGNHIYESNHSRDELPLFLILTSQAPLLESNSKFIPFSFQRVQPWLNLRRRSLYPFNYENIVRKTHFYRITKIPQNSKPRQSFLCQFIIGCCSRMRSRQCQFPAHLHNFIIPLSILRQTLQSPASRSAL